MGWIYNGNVLTQDMIPIGTIGFTYLIVCIDKEHPSYYRRYIGKKLMSTTRNVKKNKTELREQGLDKPNKRTKQPRVRGLKKTVIKESDWMNYNSSNTEVKALIDEKPESFKKIIIHFCKSNRELTYYEAKLLFNNSAIEDEKYWNDNILGTFYKKHFIQDAKAVDM